MDKIKTPKSYLARNGTRRKWRYKDWERPGWMRLKGEWVPAGAFCVDCRIAYVEMTDVNISNKNWELINPTYHKGAGILCGNRMFERLHWLGIFKVMVQ